jgi:hypothetical protein
MKAYQRWKIPLASLSAALVVLTAPVWAGRTASTQDAGFEFARIVSEFRGGASETIAPAETEPTLPIQGETLIYGTSNLFPEFGRVSVWNGFRYVELDPDSYTFNADVMGARGQEPPFASASYVVFRFPPETVRRIQNRFVLFEIFPIPPGPHGDTIEGLFLRSP